ncbi:MULTISPECIES: AAA family ATPase [Arthrobacter]|uniref:AAA family ATPase n=1 Tax=Arthrobacter TaxID=1663 RepID=UPI0015E75207|nr:MULTISPECIES: AAA family ATPase [Arthrobacter]
MRIAITGSYGAGKTTLVKKLVANVGLHYQHVPEMSSPLWQAGKQATECSRDELIELLIRRLMDRAALEFDEPDVVSDGSLLHDWVFVRTMLMHGAHPTPDVHADTSWQIESIEPIRRALLTRMADLYDLVVHLPIEFPLAVENRPVSDKFRELSDRYLISELEHLPIPTLEVTGTLDERLAQCQGAIESTTH